MGNISKKIAKVIPYGVIQKKYIYIYQGSLVRILLLEKTKYRIKRN